MYFKGKMNIGVRLEQSSATIFVLFLGRRVIIFRFAALYSTRNLIWLRISEKKISRANPTKKEAHAMGTQFFEPKKEAHTVGNRFFEPKKKLTQWVISFSNFEKKLTQWAISFST